VTRVQDGIFLDWGAGSCVMVEREQARPAVALGGGRLRLNLLWTCPLCRDSVL
jgi:hypothetical protein